jgi:AcrR family transcriptional regulator
MSPADAEPAGRRTPCRPLRRDAERNRQKILSAAAEVIAERGLDATLDDVARQAGVGVGTVYRRFPGKEALAEALFDERLGTLAAIAEHALADPDPWAGLVRPATWRRYLALFLDSLPAGRAAPTTLPEPALSPAEMEQALRSGPARQRPAGE